MLSSYLYVAFQLILGKQTSTMNRLSDC